MEAKLGKTKSTLLVLETKEYNLDMPLMKLLNICRMPFVWHISSHINLRRFEKREY